jgi:hypothetical protein
MLRGAPQLSVALMLPQLALAAAHRAASESQHTPAVQAAAPAGQAEQPPQWLRSFWKSTQVPPQLLCPPGQQRPDEQTSPLGHGPLGWVTSQATGTHPPLTQIAPFGQLLPPPSHGVAAQVPF